MPVRPLAPGDRAGWEPLWLGYNAFYGRAGASAPAAELTDATWARLAAREGVVRGFVAEEDGALVGLAHAVTHLSTLSLGPHVYLSDLFTASEARGRGIGRALIEATCRHARDLGAARVHWLTHADNAVARALYDAMAGEASFVSYRILLTPDPARG